MHSPHADSNETIVIPLFETVVYPETRTKFQVDTALGELLIAAMKSDGSASAVGLTVKGGTPPAEIPAEGLYTTGNLLMVTHAQPADDGYLVFARAVRRVKAVAVSERDGQFYAAFEPLPDIMDIDEETREKMLAEIKAAVHDISANFQGSEQFTRPVDRMGSVDQIMAFVVPFMPVEVAAKQSLLETVSVRERYAAFLALLVNLNESISLRIEVARKASEKIGKANREAMLREQLRVIQEELNGCDGSSGEEGYRERIERSTMPEEVRKKALAELRKLESGGSQHHESQGIRNYLDLLLDLPWTIEEKKSIDIEEARRVLESNHNGLEKVKERIIQHLAVMKLKEEKQGSILLLAGPPGTGKTSLGRSIADALGRKYVRISLGGVKDEAEIRGHRRTYVGSLPGRIIQGMKRAGTMNPVFVLDEVDKLAVSYSGDPASALLEVLDPEQNSTFSDHYLEVPYDLSDVLFIATANSLSTIPAPLLDRMELIEISGYTKNEKFAIAKDHLLPETLEEHGLTADHLQVEDEAVSAIIDRYTCPDRPVRLCESGLRDGRPAGRRDGGDAPRDPRPGDRPAGHGAEGEPARRRDRACLDAGRRGHPLHRGDVHARQREADADRPARRRDEGVGPDIAQPDPLAACGRSTRVRLLRKRHPHPRPGGGDPEGRAVGGCDHPDGPCLPRHRENGRPDGRDDRRGDPLGRSSPGRRDQGEGPCGAPGRDPDGHPPAGERAGPRRRPRGCPQRSYVRDRGDDRGCPPGGARDRTPRPHRAVRGEEPVRAHARVLTTLNSRGDPA